MAEALKEPRGDAVSDALRAVPPRANERERAAEDIARLAAEVGPRDAAIAALAERLAAALREGRADEARAYAAGIDPRAAADAVVARRSPIWNYVEVARNVLVLTPIAVTWYGLSTASAAYAKLLGARPELSDQPFLLLWEQGFHGMGSSIIFSTLAAIDAALIGLLILLSLAIHVRADVREARTRAASLLKESEIRAALAHATSVASSEFGSGEVDEMLDQMAAEERRQFERGVEREQQLYDLERAIVELRSSSADLARGAEALADAARALRDVQHQRQ